MSQPEKLPWHDLIAKVPTQPIDKPKTEFAKLYGTAKEDWVQIGPEQKSGFTPIRLTGSIPSPVTYFRGKVLAKYQETIFDGYTTADFEDAGATRSIHAKPSDLVGIHPMFDRKRWQSREACRVEPLYPLPSEYGQRFWTAHDDLVWKIMQPVLALASKMLWQADAYEWWDALISGERKDIEEDRWPEDQYEVRPSFHRRSRDVSRTPEAIAVRKKLFNKLVANIYWQFSSGRTTPKNNGFHDPAHYFGVSDLNRYHRRVGARIQLAFEFWVPLLRNDLPVEEKLMLQLSLARTMLHELAHCMYFLIAHRDGHTRWGEPYFEDERADELGFSMEQNVFGGAGSSATEHRMKWFDQRWIAPLAEVSQDWPDDTFEGHMLRDEDSEDKLVDRSWPIQVSWTSDIQQESFWKDCAATLGGQALNPSRSLSRIATVIEETGQRTFRKVYHAPADEIHKTINTDDSTPAAVITYLKERETRTKVIDNLQRNNSAAAKRLYAELNRLWDGGVKSQSGIHSNITEGNPILREDKQTKWFTDHLPENPHRPILAKIHNFIVTNREELALDTITAWTPFNLFLSYVNTRLFQLDAESGWRVKGEDLLDYLRLCSQAQIYFKTSILGAGMVRRIAKGWPEPAPPAPAVATKHTPEEKEDIKWAIDAIRELRFVIWRGTAVPRDDENSGFAVHDVDGDEVLRYLNIYRRLKELEEWTDEHFLKIITYLSNKGYMIKIIIPAQFQPPILRRISRGWGGGNWFPADYTPKQNRETEDNEAENMANWDMPGWKPLFTVPEPEPGLNSLDFDDMVEEYLGEPMAEGEDSGDENEGVEDENEKPRKGDGDEKPGDDENDKDGNTNNNNNNNGRGTQKPDDNSNQKDEQLKQEDDETNHKKDNAEKREGDDNKQGSNNSNKSNKSNNNNKPTKRPLSPNMSGNENEDRNTTKTNITPPFKKMKVQPIRDITGEVITTKGNCDKNGSRRRVRP